MMDVMELKKKKIHMDGAGAHTRTQIVLEEDVNISDVKPDVIRILADQGSILTDEVRALENQVLIKGRLQYEVLYLADAEQDRVACMNGEIPFSEQVNLEGVAPGDAVFADSFPEDMTITMVNSRKLSVEAVVGFRVCQEKIEVREAAVELACEEQPEYRTCSYDMTDLFVHKKDIYRVKEEVEIPANRFNIGEPVWYSVRFMNMEFRVMSEKIALQGERKAFFLYKAENGALQWFESTQPVSGVLACDGCEDTMIPEITYQVGNLSVEPRTDADGELRVFGIDAVLELDVRLYKEEQAELLADVYGVEQEIETVTEMVPVQNLKKRLSGRHRISHKITLPEEDAGVEHLMYHQTRVSVDSEQITEAGIEVHGTVCFFILYRKKGEGADCDAVRQEIPFTCLLEGVTKQDEGDGAKAVGGYGTDVQGAGAPVKITVEPEQCSVTLTDAKNLDVKMTLLCKASVWGVEEIPMITDVRVGEIDAAAQNDLPVMAVWVVSDDDTLWNIGKRFYVPVSRIKEVNELASDELSPGQKLLIVR